MDQPTQSKFTTYEPTPISDAATPLEVRSYTQISQLLAERDSIALSEVRVGQMCRIAETKLVIAFLADPQFKRWLGFTEYVQASIA